MLCGARSTLGRKSAKNISQNLAILIFFPDFCPNFRIFWFFWEKVRKSDFPTKRSHFRKKDFSFCCIRKNFFFGKLFWRNRKWTKINVQNWKCQNSFEKMDFLEFWGFWGFWGFCESFDCKIFCLQELKKF